jgi:hypothetical protein
MSNAKPTIISQKMVSKALSDPEFFATVPEFTSLKVKMATMRVKLDRPGGCSGCRKKRVVRNLYRDFMGIFNNLSTDGVNRIKTYYNVEKFLLHGREKTTGKARVKVV